MPAATRTESIVDVITRFENGFNDRDMDAIMADMTNDPVFEHVAPEAASFGRYVGRDAVRAAWESLEENFPGYRIELIDVFAAGDRAVSQWVMTWNAPEGTIQSRGANLFRMRNGKIAEKLTYLTL